MSRDTTGVPLRVIHAANDRLDRLGPIAPGSVTCVVARSADGGIPRLIEGVEKRDPWALWRLLVLDRFALGEGPPRGPVEFFYNGEPLCALSARRSRRPSFRKFPHHGKALDNALFSAVGSGPSTSGLEALVLIVDPVLTSFEIEIGRLAPRVLDAESIEAACSPGYFAVKEGSPHPLPRPPRLNVERLDQTLSTEALLFIRRAIVDKERRDKRPEAREGADS